MTYSSKYYHKNKEKFVKSNRKWRAKHKEQYNKYLSEYLKNHKEKHLKYKEHNQEKINAAAKVRYLVSKKRMKRLPCEVCGATNTHGHHPDYSKPTEVIFLCPLHHSQIHHKK